jgi:hypothetical protein
MSQRVWEPHSNRGQKVFSHFVDLQIVIVGLMDNTADFMQNEGKF